MRARDLMSTGLLTFPPDAPVETIAAALAERGVSGAPVVDADGRLLGIVTEGDLLRRLSARAEQPRGWLRALFANPAAEAERFVRAEGRRARDVMTTDLVTVSEDATAEEIAHLMETRGIKRVPVLSEGRLVGIVSRADLLRALLSSPAQASGPRSDAEIRRDLMAALRRQPWYDAYHVLAEVQGGVVTLHGFCSSPAVERALRVLAEGIPGVKRVELDLAPPPPFLLSAG
ncbi:MAG: CBS domain-containing protein [Rhodovarius sp.]|nr:CBS domain-containing protein [Rhodovarius sp.]